VCVSFLIKEFCPMPVSPLIFRSGLYDVLESGNFIFKRSQQSKHSGFHGGEYDGDNFRDI
jgi:hypothetical protein